MIKQDNISLFFFVISLTTLPFLFVDAQNYPGGWLADPYTYGVFVAIFLSLIGIAGEPLAAKFANKRLPDVDTAIDDTQALHIGIGVLVALFGFSLFNAFIPQLSLVKTDTIQIKSFYGVFVFSIAGVVATAGAFLFTVIQIPTAEENFFRGFLANLFVERNGPFIGLLVQAAVFMVFHIPVYGYSWQNLGIIYAAGLTIGGIDVATGTISTGLLAHVGNNALSFLVITGSVLLPIPSVIGGVSTGLLISLPIYLATYAIVRALRQPQLERMAANLGDGARWAR